MENQNEKKTEELENLLKNAAALKDYTRLKKEFPGTTSLSGYLGEYLTRKGFDKAEVIRNSQLADNYAYAIFNGNKSHPARDRIIALCLAMHMSLEDAQRALKISNAGILYARNQRDALIMLAFNTGSYDVMKLNEFLLENGLGILETSRQSGS